MKKVILLISILILLTGCISLGLYNLGNFILPDDSEFLDLIKELDSPQKISNYMLKNFIFELHINYAISPYELWKTKKGDDNDFASFGMFMAYHNDIEAYIIITRYYDPFMKHAIAVYVEDDGLSFTDWQCYFRNNGSYFNSFEEIVNWESVNVLSNEWTVYRVYDYDNKLVETGYND